MRFKEYRKLIAAAAISSMLAAMPAASVFAEPADLGNLFPPTKNETVYIKTDDNGQAKKIIVSDELINNGGAPTLDDISSLKDIENIKGEEDFSRSGESLTWNSKGGDIVYQGESADKIPLGVGITYELDGKKMKAGDLAGKSGHLKVTCHYDYDASLTDGKYTPFLMVTGTVLNHDHFRNVELSGNGHFESDGQRTVVVGYSVPGLLDYLGIEEKEADLGKNITLSDDFYYEADVDDFEMPLSGTIATNQIFAELNADDAADSVDSLESSLNQLSDSSKQLVSGSSVLSEGIKQLAGGVPDLESGVKALAQGSSSLADATASLASGAASLDSGIGQMQSSVSSSMPVLKNGVSQLAEGAKALSAGIQQAAAGAQTLSGGISTLNEKAGELAAGAGTVSDGASQVNGGLYAVSAGLGNAKSSVDTLAGLAQSISTSEMSPEDQAKISTLIQGLGQLSGSLNTAQVTVGSIAAGANEVAGGAAAVADGAGQLAAATGKDSELGQGAAGLAGALSSQGQIGGGAASLDAGLSQLNGQVGTMSSTITGALGELASGSSQLKDGAQQVDSGADQLAGGLNTLNGKVPTLSSGIDRLSSGADELADGMKQFDSEGIEKLVDYMNGDVTGLLDKATAMLENARAYNNYSGLADGMNGTVKFVFVQDSED